MHGASHVFFFTRHGSTSGAEPGIGTHTGAERRDYNAYSTIFVPSQDTVQIAENG